MGSERRIYNRIKSALALKQIKNKQLAEHLNISEQTVSKWCTNYSQPSLPDLYAIAEFLKVDLLDLLEPMHSK